jgi:hypothetical protein
MGRRAKDPLIMDNDNLKNGKSHPALTPEDRENQLISLAMDRAEQQLRDGTASSQVITHFLRRGTIEAELQLEKLKKENALLEAKKNAIESAENMEKVYSEAIKAMQRYRGINDGE